MMKRAVLLLSMLLLCGCSPAGSDAAAPPSEAAAVRTTEASLFYPEAPDTQSLTIARTEHNRYITEAIETFNRLSPATPLESIWYTDNENELKLSLIAGDGPDLISLDGFDYEIYADKGVFCNLYDWLDADPELSGDALLSPILRSMEWSDHTLYQLSPSFYLQSMYVSPQVWGPDQPFTLPNIAQWMDAHPDAAFTINADTPGDLLSLLLDGCMDDYANYTERTCDFGNSFVQLLSDVKRWAERDSETAALEENAFQSGSILCGWNQLKSFDGCHGLIDQGLTCSVGFPGTDHTTVFAGSVMRYAICSGTGREDLAWQFLKATLAPDYQETVPWLPLLKSEWDRRAQKAMEETPASVTEAYRNPADAALGGNTTTVTVTTAPVRGLTQEEIDSMNELVNQVSSFSGNTNVELRTIIFDEVDGYFSGQKSAEAVADVIQNRAGIYLSEQQ